MDLFAGKKLMDEGITAEALDSINIDYKLLPADEAMKVARAKVLSEIVNDHERDRQHRERAERGFLNRSEERQAKRTMRAQVRRYHRILVTIETKGAAKKARRLKEKNRRAAVRLQRV